MVKIHRPASENTGGNSRAQRPRNTLGRLTYVPTWTVRFLERKSVNTVPRTLQCHCPYSYTQIALLCPHSQRAPKRPD